MLKLINVTSSESSRTWTGQWISHPDWAAPRPDLTRTPVLRRLFTPPARIPRATLNIVGVGVWVARINGLLISDDELEPGMSEFTKRVAWVSHDVTHLLQPGENVITIALGEGSAHVREASGRYAKFTEQRLPPRALVELDLELTDGGSAKIISDQSWSSTLGPTTMSHWFGGEDYDARLEPTSLELWQPVVELGDVSTGPAPWRRQAPPVRVVDRFSPQQIQPLAPGIVSVDFGVNFAGRQVLRLAHDFPPDIRIEMWPAEYLGDDGHVDQHTTGWPIFDSYTTTGGSAVWRPQFCYHGFRFLELHVIDAEGDPRADLVEQVGVTAEQLMTDDQASGTFRCSDSTLNGIYGLVSRAVQSNLFSVPTDCPHREKLGWLEQDHLVFEPVAQFFDVHDHFSDLITHMIDAQTDAGMIPDTAPELVEFDFDPGFRDDVNWGGAIWLLPWALYREYGDLAPARAAWDAGVRYLDYLDGLAGDGILDHGLGDWITLDASTPRQLVSGWGHVQVLRAAVHVAKALGHRSASRTYEDQADRIATMIRQEFVITKDDQVNCGSGSQASYALLLDLDLFSITERRGVVADLIATIEGADCQITVGEIALPALIRTLIKEDQHALWHRMATRLEGPSYGRMLADGCTALAESWEGTESGISANHFMLGYVAHWLTGSVGGLRQSAGSIGWDEVVFAPVPPADVSSASVRYASPLGAYEADWRIDDQGILVVVITIPPSGSGNFFPPNGFRLPGGHGRPSSTELGPGRHVLRLRPAAS